MYLFLTPSKTDSRVHSRQGAPTTGNLIYWEFSQQTYVQTLLASLGVVKARKSALQCGGGGGGGEIHPFTCVCWVLRRGGGEMFQTSRHRIPSYTLHYLFPSNTFLQGHIIFPNLPATKNFPKNRCFEEHIQWVLLIVEKTANDNAIEMGNVYLRDE